MTPPGWLPNNKHKVISTNQLPEQHHPLSRPTPSTCNLLYLLKKRKNNGSMRAILFMISSAMRKPLPPSIRLFGSIPRMPLPTPAKALPLITSSGMRRPLPPATRPFGSIPTLPRPTTTRATPLRDWETKKKRDKPTQEQEHLAILAREERPESGGERP